MKSAAFYFFVLLSMVALPACGKDVEPHRRLEEIEAEARTMSRRNLEKTARRYGDAIVSRTQEFRKFEARIKDIPLAEQMDKKAVTWKDQAGALSREISSLRRRYDVYMHFYIEKGGDIEKIRIRW